MAFIRHRGILLNAAALALVACTAHSAPIRYNRDIRPILSDNCFLCHGPDKNHRKAKLRLDQREVALEKKAFLPGNPDESELVRRIFSNDPDEVMPPSDTHKTLTTEQKHLLKSWIAQGAEYEPHWAYIKPTRPEIPNVNNREWVRNPIDAFVLAELEKRNIAPSPEADAHTLIRRLHLDLVGLPPWPKQAASFRPEGYAAEVKRLLASPHYGERMAVEWLDVVRFADTVGYHGDQNVNIFPYRDYVIDAFNANKPFDQFTIEQLAGDLLPNPTVEQRVATGFNRLNMVTREGGAQPREYLAKYAADRVRTVSMAWLGSTMGCAECHDHKFDPFLTKDFYSLAAFFADIKQWGVYQDYPYTPNPDLKGWSNDHPFPPELEVDSPYLSARQERLRKQIAERMDEFARACAEDSAFASWRDGAEEFLGKNPAGWLTPKPNASGHTNVMLLPNNAVLYRGKAAATNVIEIEPGPGRWTALRFELLPHKKHADRILREKTNGATLQVSAGVKPANAGKEKKLSFQFADADRKGVIYANGAPQLGVTSGWKLTAVNSKKAHTAVYVFDSPVELKAGDVLSVSVKPDVLGAVRLSVSPFALADPLRMMKPSVFTSALQAASDTTKRDRAEMFLLSAASDTNLIAQRRELHRDLLDCRNGRALTLVTESREPMLTRVLPRGNWQDESGEVVQAAPPHFLPQVAAQSERLTRLDLAHWLVEPENPLTARTIVNRLWKQFFGSGLCATVDDLGSQGDIPSHPELLDWLAVEFRESGWDIKHMVQLMVSSATYRQQSQLRQDLREIDPQNRLLASQNPRRLEAEFVRDNALAISGLLVDDIGGPSVRPFQPPGYYANLQFPDRDYIPQTDDRQYRRGVYMHWQRTFLHPMLANFDAPSREECTANRVVSNTPQQALTLLNDPCFFEMARALAQKLVALNESEEARINTAYQFALARDAKPKEIASLKEFLARQRANDPAELAAWTSLCRVVLNLHETITIY